MNSTVASERPRSQATCAPLDTVDSGAQRAGVVDVGPVQEALVDHLAVLVAEDVLHQPDDAAGTARQVEPAPLLLRAPEDDGGVGALQLRQVSILAAASPAGVTNYGSMQQLGALRESPHRP